ncbi:MAG: hypothetical protein ACRDPM_03695 [Solirubrobacteraceae bacterium]
MKPWTACARSSATTAPGIAQNAAPAAVIGSFAARNATWCPPTVVPGVNGGGAGMRAPRSRLASARSISSSRRTASGPASAAIGSPAR